MLYLLNAKIESFEKSTFHPLPKGRGLSAQQDKLQRGIILEFKAVENEEDLEETARKALEQIHNRKYHIELKQRDITNIVSIGMAFSSKHLKIYHNIN